MEFQQKLNLSEQFFNFFRLDYLTRLFRHFRVPNKKDIMGLITKIFDSMALHFDIKFGIGH